MTQVHFKCGSRVVVSIYKCAYVNTGNYQKTDSRAKLVLQAIEDIGK